MKKTYFMLLVSMFMLLVASSAFGAEWKEIKASGLKKMMETGDVLVVFPLSKIEFDDLHIKGSINIPMHELKEKLPKDKNKTVVFYCLGRRWVASTNAASLAVKQGYKNVYAFRDGLPGWITAGYETVTIEKLPKTKVESISTADLKGMMDGREDFILLDIRFEALVKKYRIDDKRYKNVPLDMLSDRYREITKDKKIVVIGETGKRSAIAVRFLAGKGYAEVLSVEGGMQKWVKDGYSVK